MSVRDRCVTLTGALLISLSSGVWGHGSATSSAHDAQALERLPQVDGVDSRSLRRLAGRLAEDPTDLALATRVATQLIRAAQRTGDARLYGYAERALRPWWNQSQPAPAVAVLRATVRQHHHDFDGALADLNQVLARDPHNAQAWLSRSVILVVQGDYAEARRSCLPLAARLSRLLVRTCLSNAEVLSGQAARGYRLLAEALRASPAADVQERLWALTVLAETADRLGYVGAAEAHFEQALALAPGDTYLLGAYADFLIDEGRFADVLERLSDQPRSDGLLLRRIMAERALGRAAWMRHLDELERRRTAVRQRGDSTHQREDARAHLHLLDQPDQALRLAEANWTVQREPSDARVLLEAALAAGQPAAARPVLDWLESRGLEDRHLRPLSARLRELRP